MSPALRGEDIPRTTGLYPVPTRTPDASESLVTCRCGWSALRPTWAAESARQAHATWHSRGWFPGDPSFT